MYRRSITAPRVLGAHFTSLIIGASIYCATQTAVAQEADASADDSAEPAAAEGDAPSEDQLATARLHFANGVELLQASTPNYQDAFRQFQLAYEMTNGSWKVMGNLGLCALKLERDGEALAYYEGYLEEGGDQIDPAERKHIEREMLLIKGNMATVNITTSSPDVRLSVSRQGSSVPVQIYEQEGESSELGLRSGTLTIKATNAEGKTLEWVETVSAGESAEHHFDFDAKEEPAVAAAPPPAQTTAQPTDEKKGLNGLQLGGIVAAGVGVGVLGGGVALGLMSMNTETEARDDCFDEICAEDTQADFDKAKSQALVANILFISGGVLAAAGVTLIVVGSTQSSGPQDTALAHHPEPSGAGAFSLQLTPMAQAGGGGFFAHGTF